MDGYKHVVDVKYCPPVRSDAPQFTPQAGKVRETAQGSCFTQYTVEYHEIMEGDYYHQKKPKKSNLHCLVTVAASLKPLGVFLIEEMIRGLQQLGWKKVDVSFHSAFLPFFAHSNIHVLIH